MDLARFDHQAGQATANKFNVLVHPRDLTVDPKELERDLAGEMTHYAVEQGLRLEGPVTVTIGTSSEVAPGTVLTHVEVEPGPLEIWSRLISETEALPIGRNRVLVGRSRDCDVVIGSEMVSRQHALIWRQEWQTWIQDLGSSNGTTVDGAPIDDRHPLHSGSVVGLAGINYRFMEI